MEVKDLDKLLQLCRKRGVIKLKMGDIELELSETSPIYSTQKKSVASSIDESPDKPWEQLSDEEKMFYSVGSPSSE